MINSKKYLVKSACKVLSDAYVYSTGEYPRDQISDNDLEPYAEALYDAGMLKNPETNKELPPLGATEKEYQLVGKHDEAQEFEIIGYRNGAAIVFVPSDIGDWYAFPAQPCNFIKR